MKFNSPLSENVLCAERNQLVLIVKLSMDYLTYNAVNSCSMIKSLWKFCRWKLNWEKSIIKKTITFVTLAARTSTDRLPWTTSTDALEIGPVQRCCSMSLAWSFPNSTSGRDHRISNKKRQPKKWKNLHKNNLISTWIFVIPYKWSFPFFKNKMWPRCSFCEVLKNMLKCKTGKVSQ